MSATACKKVFSDVGLEGGFCPVFSFLHYKSAHQITNTSRTDGLLENIHSV